MKSELLYQHFSTHRFYIDKEINDFKDHKMKLEVDEELEISKSKRASPEAQLRLRTDQEFSMYLSFITRLLLFMIVISFCSLVQLVYCCTNDYFDKKDIR